MKNTVFLKDLYRYYGDKKETFVQKFLRPKEIKYLFYLRAAQAAKSKITRSYFLCRLFLLRNSTHISISPKVSIGEGLYIGHLGRIVINSNCVLGKNVNIAAGVTIGQENRGERKGTPVISDNVWIGTNSVIVGNVRIGTDVLIAPLTFVNFDVPDHSIVIGNPAKVIHRDNATENYINKTV